MEGGGPARGGGRERGARPPTQRATACGGRHRVAFDRGGSTPDESRGAQAPRRPRPRAGGGDAGAATTGGASGCQRRRRGRRLPTSRVVEGSGAAFDWSNASRPARYSHILDRDRPATLERDARPEKGRVSALGTSDPSWPSPRPLRSHRHRPVLAVGSNGEGSFATSACSFAEPAGSGGAEGRGEGSVVASKLGRRAVAVEPAEIRSERRGRRLPAGAGGASRPGFS